MLPQFFIWNLPYSFQYGAVPYFLFTPPSVIKTEEIILYSDKAVFTGRMVRQNRTGIIVLEKNKKALIMVFAVTNDSNLPRHCRRLQRETADYVWCLLGYGVSNIYQLLLFS